MEITYNEFEVLRIIEKEQKKLSQREIANMACFSLGTVNKVITKLLNNNLIDENNLITNLGMKALEPFRVKRAIFLAAGFGSRMVPITLNTPKPMVLVNGQRIIESLLDAVKKAEIKEIIIVVGYLGEQFEILKKKYPNIKIVENINYSYQNSISSAYLVRKKLANAYIFESDLLLKNQNLIQKYEYHSTAFGKFVDKTDDWAYEVKNGIVVKNKLGGYNCHRVYGIIYIDNNDGIKLENDIEKVYKLPGGKKKFWEQVPLNEYKKDYKIHIRECMKNDIIEIDTFDDLKKIDKTYDV